MQDLGRGCLQALVGIGDHQGHPLQPPAQERAQEGRPEGVVLARTGRDPQHLAPSVGVDPHGHHRGHRDHPAPFPHLVEGGIKPHVGMGAFDRSVAEGIDLGVEGLADARDLRLGNAVEAEGTNEVVVEASPIGRAAEGVVDIEDVDRHSFGQ